MLAKIIRFPLVLMAAFLLSMKLQPFYKQAFQVREPSPQLEFSEILDDFLMVYYKYDTIQLRSVKVADDMYGKTYSNYEYIALRPMNNYRQLMHENRYPDTIRGKNLSLEMIQSGGKWPMFLGRSGGLSGLKWMFESHTNKLKMDLPDDLFRMTDEGIEFLNGGHNRLLNVNREKSKLFDDKMNEAGVAFPIRRYYGDPTTEKSKDNGYFIIDGNDSFFQLKMYDGLPVCVKIDLLEGIHIDWLYFIDDPVFTCYAFDTDYNIYLMRSEDNSFKQLPIYDYKRFSGDMIIIEENYFFVTLKMYGMDSYKMYVLDKQHDLVGSRESDYPPQYADSKVGRMENYFFPFRSAISSRGGQHPDMHFYDWHKFIYINVALFLVMVGIKAYKRRNFKNIFNYLDLAVVLVCGIYGFIAVLLFPNRK